MLLVFVFRQSIEPPGPSLRRCFGVLALVLSAPNDPVGVRGAYIFLEALLE